MQNVERSWTNEGSIIMFGSENKESCQKNICGSVNIVFRKTQKFRKYRMTKILGKYLLSLSVNLEFHEWKNLYYSYQKLFTQQPTLSN